MSRHFILACALIVLTTGSSLGVDVVAERKALLETDRAWASAAATGDLDRVFPNWADEAVIIAAGMPAVRGKAAIREFVSKNRAQPGFSITWDPREAVVAQDGSLGYTVGNYMISTDGPESAPNIRNGRYVETWRKDATGAWRCTMEIHSPLNTAGGPDLRPAQPSSDGAPPQTSGKKAAGTLTPVGTPLEPPKRVDVGQSCLVEMRQAYTISGTLSGSAEIDYRILVAGSCGSPAGTFDEQWIAHGTFTGQVDKADASASFTYTARVNAGGQVDGRIVFGQGLEGELDVHGNFGDGKLTYTGWLK